MRTASSWCSRAAANRRSCRVPLLPRVTIFSATERAALALASVVVTRLCLMRLQTRFRSMAFRCWPVRPSLAVRLRWRMLTNDGHRVRFFLGGFQQVRLEGHAEREAERSQFVL